MIDDERKAEELRLFLAEKGKVLKKRADKYAKEVVSGKIRAGRLTIKACERYQRDLKDKRFYIDYPVLGKVVIHFSRLRIPDINKWVSFELLDFQAFIAVNLLGFYNTKDDMRRFRRSYNEVARKAGKSTFLAGLSTFSLIHEQELDKQVIFLATTKKQASIALKYAKSMCRNSEPEIKEKVDIFKYNIEYNDGQSENILEILPAEADRLDGYNPNFVLIDEYHAHKDDSLLNIMTSATMARLNPQINIITTAGFNPESPALAMRRYVESILEQRTDDENFFGIVYHLDSEEEVHDEANWVKANPALNTIQNFDNFRKEYQTAKATRSTWLNFLVKNMNVWKTDRDIWLEIEDVERPFSFREPDMNEYANQGLNAYIGMDLSATRDLTALNLMVDNGDKLLNWSKLYLPNKAEVIRSNGITLMPWIRDGYIQKLETRIIDYDLVFEQIIEWTEMFNVINVNYDPYNSTQIVNLLEAQEIECVPIKQNAPTLSFPTKQLEKLILEEDSPLILQNPCLKWQFSNCVLYTDSNANIKLMKNKGDSIDGVVALIMSVAGMIAHKYDPEAIALDAYLKSLE
jgi:phage terminase large subunit-like protein